MAKIAIMRRSSGRSDMDELARVRAELALTERLISTAAGQASELEKAIGAMERLQGDTRAADAALMATLSSLGLHVRRRDTLVRTLASFGE
jgi:hypothetical protein